MPSVLTTFGPRLLAGSALLVILLLANIVISDRSTKTLYQNTEAVAQAHAVINALDRVMTSTVDAETGERGFLITGLESYLEPYKASLAELDGEMNHLATLVAENPAQRAAVASLRDAIDSQAGAAARDHRRPPYPGSRCGRRAGHDRSQQGDHGRHSPPGSRHAGPGTPTA